MPAAPDDIVIVHSSDLHVDDGYTMRAWNGDGNGPLAAVIDAAAGKQADVLLLTGDIFEHNRLRADVLDRTHALLVAAPMPVVMLPGNHDPLIRDSVWHRGALTSIENVHILGADGDSALFEGLDLEIWGRAHLNYDDMAPLGNAPARRAARHVVAAHGHFVDEMPAGNGPHAAWLFTPSEIADTAADYVALGHWNTLTQVGDGNIPAWYSGAPDYAQTVNVVRLDNAGATEISHAPVKGPSET